MTGTKSQMRRQGGRAASKRRSRGFTVTEELLIVAAFMGCFVYPLSKAARSTGQTMAAQMESAHQTLLTQR
jgi:hypothetical protein